MDIDSERVVEDDQMDYEEIVGDGDEVMYEPMDDEMEAEPIAASSLGSPIDSEPAPIQDVEPTPIQELELVSESNPTIAPALFSQKPPLNPIEYHLEKSADPQVDEPGDEEPGEPGDDQEVDEPVEDDHQLPEMAPDHSPRPDDYEDDDEYPYPTPASLPPILLHLPDAVRSLFTPHEQVTWLKGKEGDVTEASLADVWAAIRAEIAREGLVESGELVLTEKQMELKMGEDDLNLQTITLLELVQLHHGCGLAPPVRLYITFEPSRFVQRFNAIQQEVSAQAKEIESVNESSEMPSTRVVTKEPSRVTDRHTPDRSLGREKEEEDRRHLRPARAEYGGSRGAPGDAHPNATWANTRPILPMNISGRRIIANKHQDDDEVAENPPQRRDDDDPLDRDTETDPSEPPRKMLAVPADEVELKKAGLIDEHGVSTGDRVESPAVSHPVDITPLDDYALRHPEEEETGDLQNGLDSVLSPEVSRVSTPIATTDLFKSDLPIVPTETVESTPLEAGVVNGLEDVPEETEGDDDGELPTPLDDIVQAKVELEQAEEGVKVAQAEVDAAEVARDKAYEDDEDEGYSEEDDFVDPDVNSLPLVEKDEDPLDVVGSETVDDEGVDLGYDETVIVSKDTGSPTGPLSPGASVDVGVPEDDSVYTSDEDGVDGLAGKLVEESADASPPLTPAETLDDEPIEDADEDAPFTDSIDEPVVFAPQPLSSSGKREFDDYMRDNKDAEVQAELDELVSPKRSRASD